MTAQPLAFVLEMGVVPVVEFPLAVVLAVAVLAVVDDVPLLTVLSPANVVPPSTPLAVVLKDTGLVVCLSLSMAFPVFPLAVVFKDAVFVVFLSLSFSFVVFPVPLVLDVIGPLQYPVSITTTVSPLAVIHQHTKIVFLSYTLPQTVFPSANIGNILEFVVLVILITQQRPFYLHF
jgi:hypothetical protein